MNQQELQRMLDVATTAIIPVDPKQIGSIPGIIGFCMYQFSIGNGPSRFLNGKFNRLEYTNGLIFS